MGRSVIRQVATAVLIPMLRRALVIAAAVAALVASHAAAHMDYVFDLSWCGRIKGMPDEYRPARLKLRDRKGVPAVKLVLSGNTVEFPDCLSRHFEIPKGEHMTLSGSWYHDPELLPPYLHILVPQKTYPDGFHDGFSMLFNLETAELIELTDWETSLGGRGMTGRKVDPSSICTSVELEALKPRPAV